MSANFMIMFAPKNWFMLTGQRTIGEMTPIADTIRPSIFSLKRPKLGCEKIKVYLSDEDYEFVEGCGIFFAPTGTKIGRIVDYEY